MVIATNRIYKLQEPKTATLAFADIVVDGLLVIKGIKVVKNKNGELFVSMPQEQGKDKKWYDQVRCLSQELREDISRTVLASFAKE